MEPTRDPRYDRRPRRRSSGWLWALVIVLILGGIWWAAAWYGPWAGGEADVAEDVRFAPGEEVGLEREADLGAVEPVTDPALLGEAGDPLAMVDRAVRLDGLEVTRVVSEQAFLARPRDARRAGAEEILVVVQEEVPTGPAATEGLRDVQPGDVVAVSGTVESMVGLDLEPWDIGEDVAGDRQVFIDAERVREQPA